MKIYISHSKQFDYKNVRYKPLKDSGIKVEFIFPHESESMPFNTKKLFISKGCDLIITEVSRPATGQGIELAWAESLGIPIICIYKKNSDISGSLKLLTDTFLEYEDTNDMRSFLKIK